jgi:hypothetical protein
MPDFPASLVEFQRQFPDADDIFLPPQALKEHVEMHRLHPQEEVAVFGRTEISPEGLSLSFLQPSLAGRSAPNGGTRRQCVIAELIADELIAVDAPPPTAVVY